MYHIVITFGATLGALAAFEAIKICEINETACAHCTMKKEEFALQCSTHMRCSALSLVRITEYTKTLILTRISHTGCHDCASRDVVKPNDRIGEFLKFISTRLPEYAGKGRRSFHFREFKVSPRKMHPWRFFGIHVCANVKRTVKCLFILLHYVSRRYLQCTVSIMPNYNTFFGKFDIRQILLFGGQT